MDLEVLQQQSSAPGATSSLQSEYHLALERHNKLLKANRERASTWKKKLAIDVEKKVPDALDKAKRYKDAKKASYLKRKKEGRLRNQKAQQRSERKIKYIKGKLMEEKNINGQWVPWRRGLFTPLGAAIKLGNLDAVRWLLERNANPTQCCTETLIVKPLDLAAAEKKPEIVHLLLAHNDLQDQSKSRGALHWAVSNKMFKVVQSFIEKGYDLDEYYMEKTPLGAALTCGKTNTGDARLVKQLFNAKADILKPSKLCVTTFGDGKLTDLLTVAKAYSNSKCLKLLKAAYVAAKNQQVLRLGNSSIALPFTSYKLNS